MHDLGPNILAESSLMAVYLAVSLAIYACNRHHFLHKSTFINVNIEGFILIYNLYEAMVKLAFCFYVVK